MSVAELVRFSKIFAMNCFFFISAFIVANSYGAMVRGFFLVFLLFVDLVC